MSRENIIREIESQIIPKVRIFAILALTLIIFSPLFWVFLGFPFFIKALGSSIFVYFVTFLVTNMLKSSIRKEVEKQFDEKGNPLNF